jgi:hypothetical protein
MPGRCNAAAPAAADSTAGLRPRLAAMAYGFAAAPYAMPPCDRELLDPLPAQHKASIRELRISDICTLPNQMMLRIGQLVRADDVDFRTA